MPAISRICLVLKMCIQMRAKNPTLIKRQTFGPFLMFQKAEKVPNPSPSFFKHIQSTEVHE